MPDQSFPFHHESSGPANAPVEQVSAFLDDPQALAAHMGESSMMMPGSSMSIDVDAGGGRMIGSKVRMQGRMPGLRLSPEKVITEREAPAMKVWETIGTPKLLGISHYRMGFELTRNGASSLVRVFIDYSLPIKPPGSWIGHWLGAVFARCCTKQMVKGCHQALHLMCFSATATFSAGAVLLVGAALSLA